MKFRKKPVIVEAYQFNPLGEHKTHLPYPIRGVPAPGADNWACEGCKFHIPTLEGVHEVTPGDWIIKGIKGEYYPCKPDIFEMIYELVEE